MASKFVSHRGSAQASSTGQRNKRDNLYTHNQSARNDDTHRQATLWVADHMIAQGGGDIADLCKHNTATSKQHKRRMAEHQPTSRDQHQKHTENIAVDPCDGNNLWNMNTATLGHRRCNIRQTLKSQEQCIETWLANDWHNHGTNIAEADNFGKQALNHQWGNLGGWRRRTDTSNGKRNACSTQQIVFHSACSCGSDCHDDRRGLYILCKHTRNY